MFETSQQEPSGGDTKVIVGVVAVVVILLVAAYFLFLRGQPSSAPAAAASMPAAAHAANTPAPDAQPKMDLAIERSNLGRDQTQTMAVWNLEITNRSHDITYRNVKYATKYYDGAGNIVYQGGGTLPGELAPGDERSIDSINDGLYPVNTARYTIEITGADGFK